MVEAAQVAPAPVQVQAILVPGVAALAPAAGQRVQPALTPVLPVQADRHGYPVQGPLAQEAVVRQVAEGLQTLAHPIMMVGCGCSFVRSEPWLNGGLRLLM